jgi:hypothetical protein
MQPSFPVCTYWSWEEWCLELCFKSSIIAGDFTKIFFSLATNLSIFELRPRTVLHALCNVCAYTCISLRGTAKLRTLLKICFYWPTNSIEQSHFETPLMVRWITKFLPFMELGTLPFPQQHATGLYPESHESSSQSSSPISLPYYTPIYH